MPLVAREMLLFENSNSLLMEFGWKVKISSQTGTAMGMESSSIKKLGPMRSWDTPVGTQWQDSLGCIWSENARHWILKILMRTFIINTKCPLACWEYKICWEDVQSWRGTLVCLRFFASVFPRHLVPKSWSLPSGFVSPSYFVLCHVLQGLA